MRIYFYSSLGNSKITRRDPIFSDREPDIFGLTASVLVDSLKESGGGATPIHKLVLQLTGDWMSKPLTDRVDTQTEVIAAAKLHTRDPDSVSSILTDFNHINIREN